MANDLKTWNYGGWALGYDNYTGSKSQIKKTEFAPPSKCAVPTGIGSVKKASGAVRFGGEVNHGKAIQNGIQFVTSAIDLLLVHSGTQVFYKSGNSYVATTGLTLSETEPAHFCQAIDRVYCSQKGLGGLYVTTNGTSWALVTNGRELISLTFFNQRLYGIDTTTGYIWYSNPFGIATAPPARTLGNFATFDTSLVSGGGATNKNAGFVEFAPGSGVMPTVIFYDSTANTEALYVYTVKHGYWKISPISALQADGSLVHSIIQANGYFGSPAFRSVHKVANDQWFFDGEMLNSNGEVALYQNIRVTTKFGKLKNDLNKINTALISSPALGFKDNIVYFAFPVGSYNDRLFMFDTVLGAPSSPLEGFNCGFFITYQDGNTKRLLYGSSNPLDSYMYEMGVGADIGPNAIDFVFTPQSTDCGFKGRVKRLAQAKVYYTTVLGTVNYKVKFQETKDLTGNIQVGNSATSSVGLGSKMLGSYMLGDDYTAGSTVASLSTNSYFEIDGGFEPFERVTIEITNSNTGDSVQIDDIDYTFKLGSPFETLET